MDTFTITQLIRQLTDILEREGDLPVYTAPHYCEDCYIRPVSRSPVFELVKGSERYYRANPKRLEVDISDY